MLKRMRQRREIFSDENTLLLTKPLLFQNTTLIDGARLEPVNSSVPYEQRFYGYVFRVDELGILDVFSKGFSPRYIEWYGRGLRDLALPRHPGALSGAIDTYVCYSAARESKAWMDKHAYLIDAREVGGVVEPYYRPRIPFGRGEEYYISIGASKYNQACDHFPIAKKVHKVKIMSLTPSDKIIGAATVSPITSNSIWAPKLKLHVNPDYEGGMDGARAVAGLFNGEAEWQMITSADAAGAGI